MDNNLEYKKIKSIKRIAKKQKVYNFNVFDYESYVANGFVVHNCENYAISQVTDRNHGSTMSPSQIIILAKEHGCPSVCMTYNEPTTCFEYLMELMQLCDKNRICFLLKTNAYINKEPWKQICELSPAMNIDWKGSREFFQSITGAKSYVIEDRIREAIDYELHVEISVPLYYDTDHIEAEMEYLGRFLSSLTPTIPCHLLQVNPAYRYLDFIPSDDNIAKAFVVLSSYMTYVYR